MTVGHLQEPSFDVKVVSSALGVEAKKTAANASVTFEVMLIASNVNGPGGIGGRWHEGGLSANSHVFCSDGPPAPCKTANCSSIWISPCSIASHVLTDTIAIDPSNSAANMVFKLFPRELPADVYVFTVYVPASNSSNGTSWSYYNITGHFTVVAVADATLSELSACQWNDRCVNSSSASMATLISFKSAPSAAIVINVLPRDINGIAILRAGENITVLLTRRATSSPGMPPTVRLAASFNSKSMQYEAVVPAADMTVTGNYTVTLQTSVTTGSPQSLVFVVECSSGYVAKNITNECEPTAPTIACSADQWQDPTIGKCRQKADMVVRVSSDTLQMTLIKSSVNSSVKAELEVRLRSGDVDEIAWQASLGTNSGWLRLGNSSGAVSSNKSVDVIMVIADATGLNDTAMTGPMISNITVRSSARGNSSVFVQGAEAQTIAVHLIVKAVPYVNPSDVTITASSGRAIQSGEPTVTAGDRLAVAVKALDFERRPISRKDLSLKLQLNNLSMPLELDSTDASTNVYRAMIPADWIPDPKYVQREVCRIAPLPIGNLSLRAAARRFTEL